jgi:hypothetical protein
MSLIFGSEEISVKLFNLPPEGRHYVLLAAEVSSSQTLPRCWTGHNHLTRRCGGWDYSQDRIAQGSLDAKLDTLLPHIENVCSSSKLGDTIDY